jgi:hypothetical protein
MTTNRPPSAPGLFFGGGVFDPRGRGHPFDKLRAGSAMVSLSIPSSSAAHSKLRAMVLELE